LRARNNSEGGKWLARKTSTMFDFSLADYLLNIKSFGTQQKLNYDPGFQSGFELTIGTKLASIIGI